MPDIDVATADLVRRAQAGDKEAVGELYRQQLPAIYRYVYFRVQDQAAAEDLTAEIFMRMLEALPKYEDRGLPFAAWLYRIAHDRVVDYHRRTALRQTLSLEEPIVSDADTEATAMRSNEAEALYAALDLLTDEQRLVLQLRFFEGLDVDETARIVGKTPGAVKALQFRAIRQLAQRLEK